MFVHNIFSPVLLRHPDGTRSKSYFNEDVFNLDIRKANKEIWRPKKYKNDNNIKGKPVKIETDSESGKTENISQEYFDSLRLFLSTRKVKYVYKGTYLKYDFILKQIKKKLTIHCKKLAILEFIYIGILCLYSVNGQTYKEKNFDYALYIIIGYLIFQNLRNIKNPYIVYHL